MDLDTYVDAHRHEWERLDRLVRVGRRPRRLAPGEIDELVELYQRTATHLSVIRSRTPDPVLVARLSTLVARARTVLTGAEPASWTLLARFVVVTFPAAAWRSRRWWLGAAVGSLAVAASVAAWIAASPTVQTRLLPPTLVRQLVTRDFAHYYRAHPAADFAAQVWTNNAWVAAGALVLGVALGLPTLYILLTNALNLGVAAGYLIAAGRTAMFFGLLLPHGLLELTAVFLAAGVGLRLGWTLVDPGHRRRVDALASEGRAAVTVALGLVAVLLVSGVIEAFVTPSPLPTWARVGIGLAADGGFIGYVVWFGRRAVGAGETGDLPGMDRLPAPLPAGRSSLTVSRQPAGPGRRR